MPFADIAGAGLAGAQTGIDASLRSRALDQQKEALDLSNANVRLQRGVEQISAIGQSVSEAAKQMIQAGQDPAVVSQALRDAYKPAIESLRQSYGMFGESDQLPFGQVDALFAQIAKTPSLTQTAQGQAQAGAAGEMAGAEAQGLPQTPTQQAFRAGEADIVATEALAAERQASTALARAKTATEGMGGEALTAAMRLRTQKIADAMRLNPGMSEAAATALVDGQDKIVTEPVGGGIFRVGPQGSATEITPERAQVPLMDETGKQVSVEEMAAATGAGAVVQEAAAKTLGQISPFFVSEDTTEARTALRTLKNRLLFALSLSGRPPVIEQQRILDLLPSEGVMESETRAKAVFEQLRGDLVQVRNADAQTINAGAVGPQDAQALRARIAQLDQIIERLAPRERAAVPDATIEGPPPEEISGMSRSELSRLNMENLSSEQLRAASEAWDANHGGP